MQIYLQQQTFSFKRNDNTIKKLIISRFLLFYNVAI